MLPAVNDFLYMSLKLLEGGEKHHSYASAFRNAKENDVEYKTLEKAVVESGGRIPFIW